MKLKIILNAHMLLIAMLLFTGIEVTAQCSAISSIDFAADNPTSPEITFGTGGNEDVVESLNGPNKDLYACGDVVPFLVNLEIAADAACEDYEVFIPLQWLCNTTNAQGGVGVTSVVNFYLNNAVEGVFDGDESISQDYETVTGTLLETSCTLDAGFTITGLDPGEQIVVVVEVQLDCLPSDEGGNGGVIQASLGEGFNIEIESGVGTDCECDNLQGGQQTIPWKVDVPDCLCTDAPNITCPETKTILGCINDVLDFPMIADADIHSVIINDPTVGCDVTVTYEGDSGVMIDEMNCIAYIERTYKATNGCAPTGDPLFNTCIQRFEIAYDVGAPTITTDVIDKPLGCNPDAITFDDPVFEGGCSDVILVDGYPMTGMVITDPVDACKKSQTKTWKVTDCSELITMTSQTLSWTEDDDKPTITTDVMDKFLGCNPDAITFDDPVFEGGCSDVIPVDGYPKTGMVITDPVDGCNKSQTKTWKVTDCSELVTTTTQTLSWIEVVLTCTIEVDEDDDCSGSTVTLKAVPDTDCVLPAGYTYSYLWNTGSTTATVTVGAGNYSVIVTLNDPHGNPPSCSTTCSYTVIEDCGTAWAKADNSLCFNELDDYCSNDDQLQWGFTTPIGIGETTFDLLQGAPGECANNGSLGTDVGDVTITWDGTGDPTFNILSTDGEHYFSEVHIWIGCSPLPSKKRGKKTSCTAAPGQLGCTYEIANTEEFNINDGISGNLCVGESNCHQLWVAIHAVACDLICEDVSLLENVVSLSSENETGIEASKVKSIPTTFDYQIYPNPIENGQLDIMMNTVDDNDVSIRIFDIQGNMIHQKSLQGIKGNNKYSLDIGNFEGGVYLVNIRNGEEVITKRFIKIAK